MKPYAATYCDHIMPHRIKSTMFLLLLSVLIILFTQSTAAEDYLSEPGYTVSAKYDITGGRIIFDRSTAEPGQKITFLCLPDTGYAYSDGSLLVRTSSENVGYTYENGRFGFTMPDGDVIVSADFHAVVYRLDFYVNPVCDVTNDYKGDLMTSVFYTVENAENFNEPECPSPTGYYAEWNYNRKSLKYAPGNYSVYAIYNELEYTVPYTVYYYVGDNIMSINVPSLPFRISDFRNGNGYSHPDIIVPGYNTKSCVWDYDTDFDSLTSASVSGIKLLIPRGCAQSYTVSYYYQSEDIGKNSPFIRLGYTLPSVSEYVSPDVPEKPGYSGKWSVSPAGYLDENNNTPSDLSVYPVYTPLPDNVRSWAGCSSRRIWLSFIIVFSTIIISTAAVILAFLLRRDRILCHTSDTVSGINARSADALMSDSEALSRIEAGRRSVPGEICTVNLGAVSKAFNNGDSVNIAELKARGLVDQRCTRYKILAGGILDKALYIEADNFSLQAVKMILLMKGRVIKILK